MPFDVRMPDGTLVRNVPDGTTREQIMAKMGNHAPQPKSGWQQAGDSIVNSIAGAAQGAASIPDAFTQAAAGGMRMLNTAVGVPSEYIAEKMGNTRGAEAMRRDRLAHDRALANPVTIGGLIEKVAPTPQDNAGWWARFGSQMLGASMVPIGPKVTPPTRLPKPAPPTNRLVEAGARQKLPIRRVDVNPALRNDLGVAEASRYGGPTVRGAMGADTAAMESRIGTVAGPGNVQSEAYNLGEQIQNVGRNYISRTRQSASRMYRGADKLANGQRVVPSQAVATIDQHVADLTAQGANANSSTINFLNGLKSDLAKPGGFSIPEFQGLRTAARQAIKGDNALTVSNADRIVGDVVRSFTADAQAQLPKAASDRLAMADAFYAKRQDTIKSVFQKVLGTRGRPLAPEDATKRVFAMGKNRADYNTLSRLWEEADPATQGDIAASFAAKLGRNGKGEFSMAKFATDIGAVPKNIRVAMFGEKGAADLADLEAIATSKTGSTELLNRSRSGVVGGLKHGAALAPGTILGYMMGGPVGAVVAPALQEGATAAMQVSKANRLLSPVLQEAPRIPTALPDMSPYIPSLMAKASNDIGPLLTRQLAPRLAADSEEQRKRRK